MMKIEIYTKKYCFYCRRAKELLIKKSVLFEEIVIDDNVKLYEEMVNRCGRTTVPQVFFDNEHIGGSDDLYVLDDQGKLDVMLISAIHK
nr:glutaredoxin 3 [Blochmannia endosymbiont of Polyrhachis (Hedomyrma) turneri]